MVTLRAKPPRETHPSYPSSGKVKGSSTWRCSSCHGWDYRGMDGVVARDLRAWMGREPVEVVAILRDSVHQYTPERIPEDAARELALFLTRGLIEPERHIDVSTGRSRGEAARGAPFFQTICAVCHGLDGRKLNFGTDREPAFIGTEATENPFEVLHKIRNGQPGQDMINLRTLSPEIAADILAYEQTLPVR
ncbi:MAG: cytochrome c [Magnetococcales bacterium]|nr:cytochrome c [Magnetococcales bacterium]